MQNDPQHDISRLLRLKRFEQPAPEYFEKFLLEFHSRQRAQLLREPAWRIAWDRLCAYFGEQAPARLGYGMASTAVLVAAAITSAHILDSHPAEMAAAPGQAPAAETASLNLDAQAQLPDLPSLDRQMASQTASISPPRYVMDARPVSYVPPSSF